MKSFSQYKYINSFILFSNVSFIFFFRFFLQHPANPDLLYIIFFCHSQLTITILLCLIFASKVRRNSIISFIRYQTLHKSLYSGIMCNHVFEDFAKTLTVEQKWFLETILFANLYAFSIKFSFVQSTFNTINATYRIT